LAKQITQSKAIAINGAALWVNVEIDAQDGMVVILKFNNLLDIELTKHRTSLALLFDVTIV
jgi:hypothetical protein